MTDAQNLPRANPKVDPAGIFAVVIGFGVVFVIVAVTKGFAAALAAFVGLAVLAVVGAFIWTCVQQVRGGQAAPFWKRLLRNTLNFYPHFLMILSF